MNTRMLPSIIGIVIVNIFPIIGVLWLDWTVLNIMLSYWLESLVICFFTFFKILSSQKPVAEDEIKVAYENHQYQFSLKDKGVYALEFIWNSLGILLVHLLAIWLLFGLGETYFYFLSNIFGGGGLLFVPASLPKHWLIFAAILVLSHGYSFVLNYMMRGEYRLYSPKELMVQPYRRIIAMLLVLMAGGYLIDKINAPIWTVVVLIGAKLAIDITAHLEQHKVIRSSDGDDLVTELARQL